MHRSIECSEEVAKEGACSDIGKGTGGDPLPHLHFRRAGTEGAPSLICSSHGGFGASSPLGMNFLHLPIGSEASDRLLSYVFAFADSRDYVIRNARKRKGLAQCLVTWDRDADSGCFRS